ncbi:putative Ulp1 protease family protein [Colletotrichum sublineola]|uniref:Putative Ulp1 protease family protein n=1 Tax=Colletotrichum sublineola TaxID=1173701 RepID=A0A066XI41_COLSU|nr:putative Ulp1 protease family protein [Colletotrichum sublineola]
MKQEQEATPPADATSSFSPSISSHPFSRVTTSPCDETPQKGATLSSSDSSAPCPNPPSTRRADTARVTPSRDQEEGALRETAHAAKGASENEERGKKGSTKGAIASSHRGVPAKRYGRTPEELRERYNNSKFHSFPTYGYDLTRCNTVGEGVANTYSIDRNSKDGVPVSNPMTNYSKAKSILNGGLTGGVNTFGKDARQKRLPSVQQVEPSRSVKRQKIQTKDEAPKDRVIPKNVDLSSASPTHDAPPKTVPTVDLTDSQPSADLEVVSNRSSHDPTSSTQVPEYRSVERVHSATVSNKRARHFRLRVSKCALSTTTKESFTDDEDDLTKEEDGPPRKKHAPDQHKGNSKTAFHLPRGVGTAKGQPEDISDDELGSQDRKASRERHASSEDILDQDTRKSRKPPVARSRGDMIKVDFAKLQDVRVPRLHIARAVSSRETLDVKDLAPEDHPVLTVSNDNKSLIATDLTDKPRPDYRWLELIKVSEQLEKIFNEQMRLAGVWEGKRAPKPDDIKYLEHQEKTKLKSAVNSTPGGRSRPTSAQQNSPTQTGRKLLRHSMQGDGSESMKTPTPTTSSYFALNDAKDLQINVQRTRAIHSTQRKDGASRPVLNSSPSLYSRKSPSPIPWINQNPDWVNIWDDKPLIFPATGKNRASVYRDDISRLEEGEYLNDNLIGFYLRYLQVNLERENKALADRVYIMNTYFYPKLTDVKAGRGINYEGVKSWTAKIDLFSFDYIVVPVNENAHWYLAIICNPAKLLQRTEIQPKDENVDSAEGPGDKTNRELKEYPAEEALVSTVGEKVEQMSLKEDRPEEKQPTEDPLQDEEKALKAAYNKQRLPRKVTGTLARKQDPTEARVITLDSLGVGHSPTCGNLKSYLVREAKDKRNLEVEPPGTFGMTAKGIPEQDDHASCGAFLLGYMREFLKDPDGVVTRLIRKEPPRWDITSPAMRSELRDIIIEKRKEQNALAAEKKARRKSNVQSPATSKSPEKCQEAEPAAPRTPRPVFDAPKNPSSTVKGSQTSAHLTSHSRSSPSAKDAVGTAAADLTAAKPPTQAVPSTKDESPKGMAPSLQTEAPKSSVTSEESGLLGPLKENSEGPQTPVRRVQSHPADSSAPARPRTSPRHTKNKPVYDGGTSGMLPLLVSSPANPASEKKSASKSTKRNLSNSETLLCQLPSSPSKSARHSDIVTYRSGKKSVSPSQQLLGEMRSSSVSTRQYKSALQNGKKEAKGQESIVIEDEAPPKSSLRTMKDGPTETSRYFPPTEQPRIHSSPLSEPNVKKRHSMKNAGEAIPSIENPETVDLTTQ